MGAFLAGDEQAFRTLRGHDRKDAQRVDGFGEGPRAL